MRFLVLLALLFPASAPAQVACNTREEMGKYLEDKYQEVPVGMGLAGTVILEVLASEGGSWTIIVTSPGDRSCAIAFGESWETVPAKAVLGPKT